MLISLAGCRGEESAPHHRADAAVATSSDAVAPDPLARWTLGRIAAAQATLATVPSDRRAYLTLRQAIAGAAALLRERAPLAAEVLLGPIRSADEGGGALAALDAALASSDAALARRELERVGRALGLAQNEVGLGPLPHERALQAQSDAAYELSLLLLEASARTPAAPDAVKADLLGVLDGIEGTVGALSPPPNGEILRRIEALRATIAASADAHALRDRAGLVTEAASIGAGVRRHASALGLRLALPYRARFPRAQNGDDELVSAFTLPAPRRDPRPGDGAALAELGSLLFFEPKLSRDGARSCASCHVPARAFTDGLAAPRSLLPSEPLVRNTPTLLYTSLHAAQLWDGRFASGERQALKVIHTAAEMGLGEGELVAAVAGVPALRAGFERHFTDGVTEANVARALVAFEIAALVPGDAPIDAFARGEGDALDARMRAGLDVLAGPGRCLRCHVPPLFGGSRPLDFAAPVFATLGVPRVPNGRALDADRGRAGVTGRELDDGAFKTPTLRNVDRTAPYFHHGGFVTLEQVLELYEKGGGRGLGLDVPNQDPDVRKLELSAEQKRDALYFMREGLRDRSRPLAE